MTHLFKISISRRKLVSFACALGSLCVTGIVAAQTYPNRSVNIVIGFPPGGAIDTIARVMAPKMSADLGQPVVIENKAGAGGVIGTDYVAKAAPDGYTLTLGTTSTMAVAPGAYSKLGYDPIKSFSPVSLVAVTPYLLVVNPQVPANSLAELVTLAKSQPGKLNYASAGNGSTTQLAMEMLNDAAGISTTHIPYKGNAEADFAVVANQVQVLFGSMPALLQNAKTDKVRALAVGTAKRSPALPNVPTVAELGYPGFEAALWLGLFAPAGTPKPIIDRLNKEIFAIVATPDFKSAMEKNGADAVHNTTEQFANLVKIEAGKYGNIVKKLGIKLD